MSQSSKASQQTEQKYPVFKFRTKPVQERSIFESYAGKVAQTIVSRMSGPVLTFRALTALPARTRLYVSLGITAFAAVGLLVSDQLEKAIPAPKEQAVAASTSPTQTAT
ncbi:hypothetical protein BN946_scf185007.g58 [Trametes cinnabarina]|uniref:Uncharacterized protein n=1 Tax=Pycnoporus cinnabarinus TaxID=5643 RepID=A0A060SLA6_PYCCI|nr:hypothetical protein BN946_scf185007.g58 [Trametes cinnabarina]